VSRTWLKVSAKGNAKNWHAFECCRSLGSGWGCGRWVVAGGQVLARWTWQRNANVASTAFLLPGTKTRFLMPALKMAKHLAKKQKEIKEKSFVFFEERWQKYSLMGISRIVFFLCVIVYQDKYF